MTTLADLTAGEQFLFAVKVVSVDQVNGLSLALYGPSATLAATATIASTGVMSGQLMAAPNQVPVTIVTGFAPVAIGDVMQNNQTGEAMVCQYSRIDPDGSVVWSASADHRVEYQSNGWTTVGHVTL